MANISFRWIVVWMMRLSKRLADIVLAADGGPELAGLHLGVVTANGERSTMISNEILKSSRTLVFSLHRI